MPDSNSPLQASWIAFSIMFAALLGLGWLQLRWSGQASEAEQEQMRRGLNASANQMRGEIVRAFQQTCLEIRVPSAASAEELKSELQMRYGSIAQNRMVKGAYVATAKGMGEWGLERVTERGMMLAPWPPGFHFVQRELSFNAQFLRGGLRRELRCMIDPGTLVIHSVVTDENRRPGHPPVWYVLIELDAAYLREKFLPELVRRYFGDPAGLGYRVAILRGDGMRNAIFQTDPAPDLYAGKADVVVGVFNPPGPPPDRRVDDLPPVRGSVPWRIAVQHPAGSLEAAGSMLRRRNVGVGLAGLILLGASAVMLVLSAQRARKLARLQMEFVAGVSHELRTPVTAVQMMADNLSDETLDTPEQVRQYGRLLREQGRRLAGMVEQILLFATHERQRPVYNLQPVRIARVIADALSAERGAVEAAGMRIEQDVSADLPDALAEAPALRQCLENLIANAVKYAAAGGWLRVSASRQGNEIRVTVEDRGPGIRGNERAEIFQPFFRGASARDAQAPGTGLGLSLVKQMMESMGGRATVRSETGEGSAFTLHLLAAPVYAAEQAAQEAPRKHA